MSTPEPEKAEPSKKEDEKKVAEPPEGAAPAKLEPHPPARGPTKPPAERAKVSPAKPAPKKTDEKEASPEEEEQPEAVATEEKEEADPKEEAVKKEEPVAQQDQNEASAKSETKEDDAAPEEPTKEKEPTKEEEPTQEDEAPKDEAKEEEDAEAAPDDKKKGSVKDELGSTHAELASTHADLVSTHAEVNAKEMTPKKPEEKKSDNPRSAPTDASPLGEAPPPVPSKSSSVTKLRDDVEATRATDAEVQQEIPTFTFKNGDVYVGVFKDGLRHGKGKFTQASTGHLYIGEFLEGKKHGHGKQVEDEGVYDGGWRCGKMEGFGVYIMTTSASVYEGEWKNNSMEGKGKLTDPDGNGYEGDWVADEKHGQGIYFKEGDFKYDGEWEKGKMQGRGKYTFITTGDVYDGEWNNDVEEGYGTLSFGNNGDTYEGNWANGSRHGHGTLTSAKGGVYKGNWSEDQKNGKGKFNFASGAIYDGEWVNDEMHGSAVYTYASGNKIRTQYVRGKLDHKDEYSSPLLWRSSGFEDDVNTMKLGINKGHLAQVEELLRHYPFMDHLGIAFWRRMLILKPRHKWSPNKEKMDELLDADAYKILSKGSQLSTDQLGVVGDLKRFSTMYLPPSFLQQRIPLSAANLENSEELGRHFCQQLIFANQIDCMACVVKDLQLCLPDDLRGLGPKGTATALHLSVVSEWDIVQPSYFLLTKLLLDHGAPTEAMDHTGQTPLRYAVNNSLIEAVQLLLDGKADPNSQDKEDASPLQAAVVKGDTSIATLLLSHGGNLRWEDGVGTTLLHCAAMHGHLDMLKLLLDYPADGEGGGDKEKQEPLDVNAVGGSDLSTPLHLLAWHRGNNECFKFLVSRGADPELKDQLGRTPNDFISEDFCQPLLTTDTVTLCPRWYIDAEEPASPV